MEFKTVLKILAREGYPNPNLGNIFDAIDYDSENFLGDLVENLGEEGATEFVSKTLYKISSKNTIKIPLDYTISPGSWIELIINDFEINLHEESSDILINSHWGDSYFIHPETGKKGTFQDVIDDEDPWDYSDLIDSMRDESYGYIQKRCGFGIWFN
jgi:hypothetical protein